MNDYQEIVKKFPRLFKRKANGMPFTMFGFEYRPNGTLNFPLLFTRYNPLKHVLFKNNNLDIPPYCFP